MKKAAAFVMGASAFQIKEEVNNLDYIRIRSAKKDLEGFFYSINSKNSIVDNSSAINCGIKIELFTFVACCVINTQTYRKKNFILFYVFLIQNKKEFLLDFNTDFIDKLKFDIVDYKKLFIYVLNLKI